MRLGWLSVCDCERGLPGETRSTLEHSRKRLRHLLQAHVGEDFPDSGILAEAGEIGPMVGHREHGIANLKGPEDVLDGLLSLSGGRGSHGQVSELDIALCGTGGEFGVQRLGGRGFVPVVLVTR
jgi:hypothetical protein